MAEFHRLSPRMLAELSSGVCGTDSLDVLRAGQLSRHLLLIRHVADSAPASAHSSDVLAVLDAARARDPQAAAWVLSDPMVGAWLAQVVRRLHHASRLPPGELAALAALAAAAAARCGLDTDLTVEQRQQAVMIPTLGLLTGCPAEGQPLRLRVRDGELSVADGVRVRRLPRPEEPGESDGRWQGLRHVAAPAMATLTLDDISPARHTYGALPAGRTNDAELDRWRRLTISAAGLLSRHATALAAETGQILRTIVPLLKDEGRTHNSATARHAFGALADTRPASSAALAVSLAHEARHSVFNALLQLETLFDRDDPGGYFAPWRTEPRPIWGLFHGVYAFLTVAEVQNRLRAEPAGESAAEKEFAMVRARLRAAMNSLLDAPSLTGTGRSFVAGMEKHLTELESIPVPRAVAGPSWPHAAIRVAVTVQRPMSAAARCRTRPA
ncbi:aKG-HExxH-type peptide beta-hydroxylase [Micromonosporaceae bacterium Da 78-11]